ncbi:MAG: hypothetical protein S4CHLAM123_02290 [Chlamydiales bacterium]|nr:hypothetical protein [Chlamydiales bacterium]
MINRFNAYFFPQNNLSGQSNSKPDPSEPNRLFSRHSFNFIPSSKPLWGLLLLVTKVAAQNFPSDLNLTTLENPFLLSDIQWNVPGDLLQATYLGPEFSEEIDTPYRNQRNISSSGPVSSLSIEDEFIITTDLMGINVYDLKTHQLLKTVEQKVGCTTAHIASSVGFFGCGNNGTRVVDISELAKFETVTTIPSEGLSVTGILYEPQRQILWVNYGNQLGVYFYNVETPGSFSLSSYLGTPGTLGGMELGIGSELFIRVGDTIYACKTDNLSFLDIVASTAVSGLIDFTVLQKELTSFLFAIGDTGVTILEYRQSATLQPIRTFPIEGAIGLATSGPYYCPVVTSSETLLFNTTDPFNVTPINITFPTPPGANGVVTSQNTLLYPLTESNVTTIDVWATDVEITPRREDRNQQFPANITYLDGRGNRDIYSFTIFVRNLPPMITNPIGVLTGNPNELFDAEIDLNEVVTDFDDDFNDLVVSFQNLFPFQSSRTNSTLRIFGSPFEGIHIFGITITDPLNASVVDTVQIEILPPTTSSSRPEESSHPTSTSSQSQERSTSIISRSQSERSFSSTSIISSSQLERSLGSNLIITRLEESSTDPNVIALPIAIGVTAFLILGIGGVVIGRVIYNRRNEDQNAIELDPLPSSGVYVVNGNVEEVISDKVIIYTYPNLKDKQALYDTTFYIPNEDGYIARGNYGSVYVCKYIPGKCMAAIKKVKGSKKYFSSKNEAEIHAKAYKGKPVGIWPYLDSLSGEDGGQLIFGIVLKLGNGGSLEAIIKLLQENDRELFALVAAQQLLMGVEHLQKTGIAHRDLKPDNILVNVKLVDDEEKNVPNKHSKKGKRVKKIRIGISDFGRSALKIDSTDHIYKTGTKLIHNHEENTSASEDVCHSGIQKVIQSFQGTKPIYGNTFNGLPFELADPRYMPFEVTVKGVYDVEKVDLWSLGLTILELLTGLNPSEIFHFSPEDVQGKKTFNEFVTADQVQQALKNIFYNVEPGSLMELASLMMDFDPAKRLSPAQALKMPCFNVLKNKEEEINNLFLSLIPDRPTDNNNSSIPIVSDAQQLPEENVDFYHNPNDVYHTPDDVYHTPN